MSTDTHLITAEQFAEMNFDAPVELVRGEVVYLYGEDGVTRPGMRHGVVAQNVGAILWTWSREQQAGRVTCNDTGIVTERDPDTLRGPDLFFISYSRLPAGEVEPGLLQVVPNLCVEVLSPSDRWSRVRHKVNEYLDCGVEEVWVLDSDQKTLFVFHDDSAPRELSGDQILESKVLPGFRCIVAELFQGI